ncbi:MAG: glycosyltransferase [Candidatus Omnitrophota bacterium]
MNTVVTSQIIYCAFLIFLSYYLCLVVFYLFQGLNGVFESKRRYYQNKEQDYTAQYLSSSIIPVTVIIPAHNEELWIRDSLLSVLNLNYPRCEVIVVDDASTDGTFHILNEILKLVQIDLYYPRHYPDVEIKSIYKSTVHKDVYVISNVSGKKKAGALNAALDIAHGQYICAMDADTVVEPDALLEVMAHIGRDPDGIIGAESYFGLANGFIIKDGKIAKKQFSLNPIIASQNLEYIRSFIGNRVAWSKYNAVPIIAGGFGVWRKDMLYAFGGYSSDFTCEDLEITFKAQDYISKKRGKGYRILSLPYCVGWTEGPSNIKSLVSQRERWQRVINETIWKYKYMMLNPKFGLFAFLTVPYYVLYEVFGVFFEIASIAFVTWGWLTGVLRLKTFLAFLALMILAQSLISLISIFAIVRTQRVFKMKYILYLTFLTGTEFFWYRWILSIARFIGCLKTIMGVKSFTSYERSGR